MTPRTRFNLGSKTFAFLALAAFLVSTALMLTALYFNGGLAFRAQTLKSGAGLVTDFEGAYYMGDGLGATCLLKIDPGARFTITWSTDTGHREQYAGSISVEDSQFILTPEGELGEFTTCYYHNLIPIAWGDRIYLLPDNESSVYFCQDIKSGHEPRKGPFGYPYLRSTDLNISAAGFPRKPNGQIYCPFRQ